MNEAIDVMMEQGMIDQKGKDALLNHRMKNYEKYGQDIFKEYDEAMASGNKEKIRKSFKTPLGTRKSDWK